VADPRVGAVVGPIDPATKRGLTGVRSTIQFGGLAGTFDGRDVDLHRRVRSGQIELDQCRPGGRPNEVVLDDVAAGPRNSGVDRGDFFCLEGQHRYRKFFQVLVVVGQKRSARYASFVQTRDADHVPMARRAAARARRMSFGDSVGR